MSDDILKAVKLLAAIADAFDANNLDVEARKFFYPHGDDKPVLACTEPHEDVILYTGRGGKTLLTLADCEAARDALRRLP